jgi:antitoxin ParD1/3/4
MVRRNSVLFLGCARWTAMRAAAARDRAVEGWLRGDVAAAYDALLADPARGGRVDRVKARLATVHKKATSKA